jgi:hypothetical protein
LKIDADHFSARMRHARINVVMIMASRVRRSPGTPDRRRATMWHLVFFTRFVGPFSAAMKKVTLLPYFSLAWPRCRPKAATKRDANPHDVQCGELSNEAVLFCDFDAKHAALIVGAWKLLQTTGRWDPVDVNTQEVAAGAASQKGSFSRRHGETQLGMYICLAGFSSCNVFGGAHRKSARRGAVQ